MNLELDLAKIAALGEKKEDENFRFRAFLKGINPDRVDGIVSKLNRQITDAIDCTQCGNCCAHLEPQISSNELESLSQIEGITEEVFAKLYTEMVEDDMLLKGLPCKYLEDKKCKIYDQRPTDCRSYPNTHKPMFISRLYSMIDNYAICPIVYNVMEQLKRELRFR